MKRALIVTAIAIVLAGMITASIVRENRRHKGEKIYAEAVLERSISQVVKASGRLDPRVKVHISAHVIGKIAKLYVEEGDEILAGQPFLELEKEAFLAVRERTRAQLEISRSQLAQAEIDLADAALKLRRAERLADESILAPEELEAAQLRQRSAILRRNQAEEEVLRAEADLDKAQDDLEKVTLYSPISGRVIELNAEEGEVVVSGTMNNPASVIGTVADLSEILVEIDVDETEIVHVRPDQTARVEVDALPDHPYTGRVVEIGSSGFEQPQQPDVTFFKVKVLLDAPDERLRPGMSARAEIEVANHEAALVVPIQAVVYRQPLAEDSVKGGDQNTDKGPEKSEDEIEVAFVVTEGKAVQRPVETGLADTTHVEILSGLAEGEQVVTGPYRAVRDLRSGDAVKISAAGSDQDEDDPKEDES